jgi:hypothetical protein
MKDGKYKVSAASNKSSFLSTKTAAVYIGFSSFALLKWRVTGKGPHYFKIGRSVRYSVDDLDAWLEVRRRLSTSDRRKQ